MCGTNKGFRTENEDKTVAGTIYYFELGNIKLFCNLNVHGKILRYPISLLLREFY